ncbi:MAG: hypothetical protein GY732_04975 [Gammaproteobacteria bacterium]|nr:hypothetical protein [Gammaproteobacteria bacterium]
MYKKFRFALLIVASLFAVSANGEPMAYSVNSDSGNPDTEDSLYLIDLFTGVDQRRGPLSTGIVNEIRRDTEGLAFAPDGTLWGIDDSSQTLFPISVTSGAVKLQDEIPLPTFKSGGGHDFGMTFSCDGSLFVTSVVNRTLYRLDLTGKTETIGSEGALGENISAIAAYGNPTRLYGLGNGQFQDGRTDSPNLYSIDETTGVATLVGPLGKEAGEYNQGGLAFDSEGGLWAITDRRIINNSVEDLPSQILNIDVATGTATLVSNTSEVGFESLAISPPSACSVDVGSSTFRLESVPTLSPAGRLLAICIFMLAGMTVLRNRLS